MPTLYVMVGIAGSGKSTYAKKVLLPSLSKNSVLVASDDIRDEFQIAPNDKEKHAFVFQTAYRRLKEALKAGHDAILDSTALTAKIRKNVINQMGKIDNLKTQCIVLLCTPEQAIENQTKRDRKMDDEVIFNQFRRMQIPLPTEPFTEPAKFVQPFDTKHLFQTLTEQTKGFAQTGPHHVEDVFVHTKIVTKYLTDNKAPYPVITAAGWHDLGKLYCRIEDETSETLRYRFPLHAYVSANLYLCYAVRGDAPLTKEQETIWRLIFHHDDRLRNNYDENAYIDAYGAEFVRLLSLLATADQKGMIPTWTVKKLPLRTFLNTYEDWETILSAYPFCIHTSHDGAYVLLKYTQFESDMNYRLVKEARGPVLVNENGSWNYVCRPWNKFFNHGESLADDIDWAHARVTEKIDGSLMKFFYHNDAWHLATNGTIHAKNAEVRDTGITFEDLFRRALQADLTVLTDQFDTKYTYLFELTTMESKIVITYPDMIWYLGKIETKSGRESFAKTVFQNVNVQYPTVYNLSNLSDTVAAASTLSKDHEGFVVNDNKGHRLKIKSPEYLAASHLLFNGYLSDRRLFELFQEDRFDDLLAYVPSYAERVAEFMDKIQKFTTQCLQSKQHFRPFESDRKIYAETVREVPEKGFLFAVLDHPDITPSEYLKHLTVKSGLKQLKRF